MKVSIIIPIFNLAQCVAKAIESCLKQTYHNIEIIIINDGSTDDSESVINKYTTDNRIKYYTQPNRGVSSARNKGVSLATGDYITFLDGDDMLQIDTIEKNISLIESIHRPVDWLTFPVIRENEHGREITAATHLLQSYRYQQVEELTAREVYQRYENSQFPPVICAMLFKKSFFDTQFVDGRYEDTYMFLELLTKNPFVIVSPYGAYRYVNREDSFINAAFTAEKWCAYTRARIKAIQTGKFLFPERKKIFDKQYTAMYYNLKYVRFKNRDDRRFVAPLTFLQKKCPYIKKNWWLNMRYLAKCLYSLLPLSVLKK